MRCHVSIWSAIYKKAYLNDNNIRVLETANASYQDMPFAALVYAKGAKITLLHEALINYRLEDGMNSSTKRTDERLKMMPVMCQKAKDYFIENNCWDEVKEATYRHFYNCSVGMWKTIDDEYKKAHFDELVKLFGNIEQENVQYKYINRKQKEVLRLIVANDFEGLMKHYRKVSFKDFLKKLMFRRSDA